MHLHRYGVVRLHWVGVNLLMSVRTCKRCPKLKVEWIG